MSATAVVAEPRREIDICDRLVVEGGNHVTYQDLRLTQLAARFEHDEAIQGAEPICSGTGAQLASPVCPLRL